MHVMCVGPPRGGRLPLWVHLFPVAVQPLDTRVNSQAHGMDRTTWRKNLEILESRSHPFT